jgi:hypothetical protein
MANLTLREVGATAKGSPLTNAEIDNNIINLNTELSTKANTNSPTFTGTVGGITAAMVGLGNVENKSSATIRGEITSANVTTALGFTPYNATNPDSPIRINPTRVAANFTLPTGYNGASAGPISIDDGVTVTISNGATWSIH